MHSEPKDSRLGQSRPADGRAAGLAGERVRSFSRMLRGVVLVCGLTAGLTGMDEAFAQVPEDAPVLTPAPEEKEEEEKKEPEEKEGFEGIGIPLVSYNTDLGFGIGAVGGAYYYSPGYTPYRHAMSAQFFLTTEGVRNHYISYDGPNLLGRARLKVRAEYRRDLFFPFYGVGNVSAPDFDPAGSAPREFAFDQFYPGGRVEITAKPLGNTHPLELSGGLAYHQVRIRPYPGSILEQTQPVGIQGGHHGQVVVGVTWDTRDFEPDPIRGGVQEVSVRLSGAPTLSDYAYTGITLSGRYFWQLAPNVVFAQRVMLDALFGEVPVFVLADISSIGIEGVGGMSSVRGVPRNRYVGNVKVISNSELRFYVFEFNLLGEAVKIGGVGYFDVGRVWHPNVDDGPWWRWHPGVGTGLRVARLAAVVRLDYAVATEDFRQAVYVTFGHMF